MTPTRSLWPLPRRAAPAIPGAFEATGGSGGGMARDGGGEEPEGAEEAVEAFPEDEDAIGETIALEAEDSPSARDIVEEVESGIDLDQPGEDLLAVGEELEEP